MLHEGPGVVVKGSTLPTPLVLPGLVSPPVPAPAAAAAAGDGLQLLLLLQQHCLAHSALL